MKFEYLCKFFVTAKKLQAKLPHVRGWLSPCPMCPDDSPDTPDPHGDDVRLYPAGGGVT
jgi:hypothetical protein